MSVSGISEILADLHDLKTHFIRWYLLLILGQTAVLLGGGYFILSHLRA